MFLRSNWRASHIADPDRKLNLDTYHRSRGIHPSAPIPLERFIDYGHWYQRQAVPEVEQRFVTSIEAVADFFKLALADGENFTSRRAVLPRELAISYAGRRNSIRFH
jgi:hypothetical protein